MGQAHVLYLVQPGGAAADSAPQLMSFHTITGSWATLAAPDAAGVRAVAAWNNGIVWERAAADGTHAFGLAEVESGKLLLKWLDWVVIVVYLVSMLGIGLYFYLREKRNSTSDFFVGGRSIPFWAAGVSLYAANTSSISYIAIPAKAFETNWQYLTNNLVAVLGLMFVAVWIVPLLRRLDLMSVFSYLETRFHPAIRMLSSGLCILVQLGSRMSVILFLPALAIATITGIDVVWSILLMGGFTIAYTALGGMKAVVWTDVVQLVVKMGGALFAIGFMIYKLNGGFGEFMEVAAAANKTQMFDFSFDLTKATVWGFIFLVLFDVVLTFPKDQVLMQRTLSTKSDRDAGRSIWTLALIMIPGGFVFYTIGTALFVFYKANPERMNPLLSIDATFPMFIAAELPMGVTGLIIAGIFAAAMATLSSIMNSVATLASVDFYEKLVKKPDPKKSVLFAEIMTVVAGLVGVGFALLLSRYDIHSLFDVSIELAGLLGGGFAGAYTLGMFTRRANSPGVAIGVGSAIVLTTVAWSMNLVHPYFYLAISILLCIVIGYLASLLFPAPTRSLRGLTIYSDGEAAPEAARPAEHAARA
jgi:SSS family solute:Na+ symporter